MVDQSWMVSKLPELVFRNPPLDCGLELPLVLEAWELPLEDDGLDDELYRSGLPANPPSGLGRLCQNFLAFCLLSSTFSPP
mmetsp:Transcript_37650/g.58780  ORF Transcript_37650/g.58780 Transcript_37650/m.58780 type:complete len:81 (+) Transcript_37650:107-349(+)